MKSTLNKNDFNHKCVVKVRFHEVDMLGVCNNAVYVTYFETARLEYLKAAGLIPEKGIFSDGFDFYMVRNEINYLAHSRYDDELEVYTRISYIKKSSYGFDHLVYNNTSAVIVAEGKGVVVQVDPKTGKSHPLSEIFREKVSKFENKKLEAED
ncbi:MAG: acyl-CoA thioesterase [Ignavibacteriaceae bacterium]|nr:acyl-CoA thioesterase [Ignavibacteriaceae bacterium]